MHSDDSVAVLIQHFSGMLRRSMSGNSGLNNMGGLGNSSSMIRRPNEQRDNMSNNAGVSPGGNQQAYRASLVSHYAEDLDRRRRAERAIEECRTDGSTDSSSIHLIRPPY